MNIVNKLTLRHMMQNKRRTIVTIIGVIISVAMITAVMTLGVSFQDLMKRQVINDSGEWHVGYYNVTPEQAELIRDDEATKMLMLNQEQGYASLTDMGLSSYPNKPYIAVSAYNAKGFEKFPQTLVQGRLPEKAGEIVVPKLFLDEVEGADIKLGDQITLSLGTRYLEDGVMEWSEQRSDFTLRTGAFTGGDQLFEKLKDLHKEKFTVVGIIETPTWEYSWVPGYVFYTFLDPSTLTSEEQMTATVIVNEVNNSIYTHAEQLAAELGVDYFTNSGLLRYDFVSMNNGFLAAMYMLTAIIMIIVIVGSVALIYNAFGISVADRSRYLGMLASVGATRRQKRNSVFFEGFLISLVSIPIGFLSGLLGLTITFWSINSMIQDLFGVNESLKVVITPMTLIVSVAISLLTIFASTWWPARRASKVSPIDAIRQSMDVKLSKRKVKNNFLVKKLFGIEADIALKNLKRNKRRYQVTVFSLVISIILFLSVSFFTNTMTKAVQVANDGVNYDINIGSFRDEDSFATSFDAIKTLEGVTSYNELTSFNGSTQVDVSLLPPGMKKMFEFENGTDIKDTLYNVSIYSMPDEALIQFAQENSIDAAPLLDSSSANAILLNSVQYYSGVEEKKIEEAPILKAQDMNLEVTTWVDKEIKKDNGEIQYETIEKDLAPIHISALVSEYPMGIVKGERGPFNMTLIVSQHTMKSFATNVNGLILTNELFLQSKDPVKLQQSIYELELPDYLYINNYFESRQSEEQMIVLIGVFTYGFIALITLISIANILNTISTGIQLRRREFAMLRSMGMTKQGFYRMINYESIFYGLKSLLYGLPISGLVMYLIYRSMGNTIDYNFQIPWMSVIIAILGVFGIVTISMLYSGSKVKKGSIVDAIKQENL